VRERHEAKWREVLTRHYRRQEAAIVSRVPAAVGKATELGGVVWWDDERWNEELFADLLKLNVFTALAWGMEMAGRLDAEVSEEVMRPWLEEHARIQAEYINGMTRDAVERALTDRRRWRR
jgi:hypothetical protein